MTQQFQYQLAKTQIQQTNTSSPRRVATQHFPHQDIDYNGNINTGKEKKDGSSSSVKDRKKMLKSLNLHQQAQNRIQKEIQIGKIYITDKQIKLKHLTQRKAKTSNENHISQIQIKEEIIRNQKKKIQAIKMLRSIEDQQKHLKKKQISIKIKKLDQQAKSASKKLRSYFSPQQRRQVKKMLKRKLILEQQLNQKTLTALKQYQTISRIQRQTYVQQIQKQRSFHRSFVQQSMKSFQKRRLQRIQEIEQGNKNFIEIKNKKYKYQTNQQIQRYKQELQIKQKMRKIDQIKNRMKVTTSEQIREHREKYKQLMKSKVQMKNSKILKRSQFFSSQSLANCNSSSMNMKKKIEDNYWTKLVKHQLEQKKQQQDQIKKKPFQLKQKVKQFSQNFDLKIRPSIKITQQSRFIPIIKNNSLHSLSYNQQRNQGKQYLSIARKMKKYQSVQQRQVFEKKISENLMKQAKKHNANYKNYLQQMRRQSQLNPQSVPKKVELFLEKQGSISQFNKLNKAVIYVEGVQAKSKKSKDQKLIDSVQNKINILKMIV